MNLVDEKDFALSKTCQNGREIARALQHGPSSRAYRHSQLLSDHVGERGFAEAWRPVEKNMIESFAALARRCNRYLQIGTDTLLADVVVECARPQPRLVLDVFIDPGSRHNPRVIH